MSRIDLTPLETTATPHLPSSVRSAEMSKVVSPSRWTPPIPKKTNPLLLPQTAFSLFYEFSFKIDASDTSLCDLSV
jgi:hypothetical protein